MSSESSSNFSGDASSSLESSEGGGSSAHSSHSGDSFGASYRDRSFESDLDGSSTNNTFGQGSSVLSHASSTDVYNTASIAEAPEYTKDRPDAMARVTSDVRGGKEQPKDQKHVDESSKSHSGSFPGDASNGSDAESASSAVDSQDSRMSMLDGHVDDSISSSSSNSRSRSAHSSSLANDDGGDPFNRSNESQGSSASAQRSARSHGHDDHSFSSRRSGSHASSNEESRRIDTKDDKSANSHDDASASRRSSSSRRSEPFSGSNDDNNASFSSRSSNRSTASARSASSSSHRHSAASSPRSLSSSTPRSMPGDSWHSRFSDEGPQENTLSAPSNNASSSQYNGPPPLFKSQNDGPPPLFKSEPPPLFKSQDDGPPPLFMSKNDGPPPLFKSKNDGPPPLFKSEPPPLFKSQSDGPPPLFKPEPPPLFKSQNDGPPPLFKPEISVQQFRDEKASVASKQSANSARSRGASNSEASRSTVLSNAIGSTSEPTIGMDGGSWHSRFSAGRQEGLSERDNGSDYGSSSFPSSGGSRSEVSRSTVPSNAVGSTSEPTGGSWHSRFSAGPPNDLSQRNNGPDDGSLSSRRTGSAHSSAQSRGEMDEAAVESMQTESFIPIVSEHSAVGSGSISEPGGLWHSHSPEPNGRLSPSENEADGSEASDSSRLSDDADASVTNCPPHDDHSGSSRRSSRSAEKMDDTNSTRSNDSANTVRSVSPHSLSESKRSAGGDESSMRSKSEAASGSVSSGRSSSKGREDFAADDSEVTDEHSSSTKLSTRSDSAHSSRRSVSVHSADDSRGARSFSESTVGRSLSSHSESFRRDDGDASISGRFDQPYSSERSKSRRSDDESSLSRQSSSPADCGDLRRPESDFSAEPCNDTQTCFIDGSVTKLHRSSSSPRSRSSGSSGSRVSASMRSESSRASMSRREKRVQSPSPRGSPINSSHDSASVTVSVVEMGVSMPSQSISSPATASKDFVIEDSADKLKLGRDAPVHGYGDGASESSQNGPHPDDSERRGRLEAAFDLYESNYLNNSNRSMSGSNDNIVDASADAFDRIISETKQIVGGVDGDNDQDFFYTTSFPNERNDNASACQASAPVDYSGIAGMAETAKDLVNRAMSKFAFLDESNSSSRLEGHDDQSSEPEQAEDLVEIAKELRAVIAQLPSSHKTSDSDVQSQDESTRDSDPSPQSLDDDVESSSDLSNSRPAKQDGTKPAGPETECLPPSAHTYNELYGNCSMPVTADDSSKHSIDHDDDMNRLPGTESELHDNGLLVNSTLEMSDACHGTMQLGEGKEGSECADDASSVEDLSSRQEFGSPEPSCFSESSRSMSVSNPESESAEDASMQRQEFGSPRPSSFSESSGSNSFSNHEIGSADNTSIAENRISRLEVGSVELGCCSKSGRSASVSNDESKGDEEAPTGENHSFKQEFGTPKPSPYSESSRPRSALNAKKIGSEESDSDVESAHKTNFGDDNSIGSASDEDNERPTLQFPESVIESMSQQAPPPSPSQSTLSSSASSRSCSENNAVASHTSVSSSGSRHRDSDESSIIDSGKTGLIDGSWSTGVNEACGTGDSDVAASLDAERKTSTISPEWLLSADQAMQQLLTRGLSAQQSTSTKNLRHEEDKLATPATFQTPAESIKKAPIDKDWLNNADEVLRRITKRADEEGTSTPGTALINTAQNLELPLEHIHRRPDKFVDKDWLTNADALLHRFQKRENPGSERSPSVAEPDKYVVCTQNDDSMPAEPSEASATTISIADEDNRSASTSAELENRVAKNTNIHVDKEWLDNAADVLERIKTRQKEIPEAINSSKTVECGTQPLHPKSNDQESRGANDSAVSNQGKAERVQKSAPIDDDWLKNADDVLARIRMKETKETTEPVETGTNKGNPITITDDWKRSADLAMQMLLSRESQFNTDESDTIGSSSASQSSPSYVSDQSDDFPSATETKASESRSEDEYPEDHEDELAVDHGHADARVDANGNSTDHVKGAVDQEQPMVSSDWFAKADALLNGLASRKVEHETNSCSNKGSDPPPMRSSRPFFPSDESPVEPFHGERSSNDRDATEKKEGLAMGIDEDWMARADRVLAKFQKPSTSRAADDVCLARPGSSLSNKSPGEPYRQEPSLDDHEARPEIDKNWLQEHAVMILANLQEPTAEADTSKEHFDDDEDAFVERDSNTSGSSNGEFEMDGTNTLRDQSGTEVAREEKIDKNWLEQANILLAKLQEPIVAPDKMDLNEQNDVDHDDGFLSDPDDDSRPSSHSGQPDERNQQALDQSRDDWADNPDWLDQAYAGFGVKSNSPDNQRPTRIVDKEEDSGSNGSCLTEDELWDLDSKSAGSCLKSKSDDSESEASFVSIMSGDQNLGMIFEEEDSSAVELGSDSQAKSRKNDEENSSTSGSEADSKVRHEQDENNDPSAYSTASSVVNLSSDQKFSMASSVKREESPSHGQKTPKPLCDKGEENPSRVGKEIGFFSTESYEGTLSQDDKSVLSNDSREQKKKAWIFKGTILLVVVIVCILILLVPWLVRTSRSSKPMTPTGQPVNPFLPLYPPGTQPQASSAPASPPSPAQYTNFWMIETKFDGSSGVGGFGASIASVVPGLLVIGEPLDDKFTSFQVDRVSSLWSEQQEVYHDDLGSGFGSSISKIVGNGMITGAPFAIINGTDVSVGAALFFTYDSLQARWQQFGGVLRGDENIELSASEKFGSSVALGTDYRVAVGAPGSSLAGPFAGRVYTFELDKQTLDWKRLEPFPLFGEEAGDSFGSVVAISGNGLTLFVGSPGSVTGGRVQILTWSNGDWVQKQTLEARTEGESFGTSIDLADENGDLIIVGAPRHGGDKGRVNLYQKNVLNGLYEQIGEDIEGSPGSYFGESQGISSFSSSYGVHLAILSQTGEAIRVDFSFAESRWKYHFEPVAISPSDRNSINMFTDGSVDRLVVGLPVDEMISIYSSESLKSNAVTPPPATRPPAKKPSKSPTRSPAPLRIPRTAAPVRAPPTVAPISTPLTVAPTKASPITAPIRTPPTKAPISNNAPTTTKPTNMPLKAATVTATPVITIAQPTSPPTRFAWAERGGPYRIGQTGTGYGSAVALSTDVAIVSVPLGVGVGVVLSFKQQNGIWQDTPSQQLGGLQEQSRFGAAVGLHDDLLLIGAPDDVNNATLTRSGSASCHGWVDGSWIQQGPFLFGSTSGLDGSDEEFGAAVAIGSAKRIAVGAPGSSANGAARCGRVYIFERDVSTSGKWTRTGELVGRQAGDEFGKATAFSRDGNFLAIGSPGDRAGFATIYQHNSLGWFPTSRIIGEFDGEATGSSVCFLRNDGSSVAVGSPSFENGKGRIFVYERNELTGRYSPLGEPLVGASGERFGAANKIAGNVAVGNHLNVVLVGTTFGLLKTFAFNRSTNTWAQIMDNVDTGYRSGTGLLSVASHDNMIAVGGNDAASIYELRPI